MHKKSIYDATFWDNTSTKVAILVPTKDTVYSEFTFSLSNLIKTSTQAGLDIYPVFDSSTILINQRIYLVKRAQKLNVDYFFWMDSDMHLPSTTILRLLSHDKEIVCGNYMKRAAPFKTVAYQDVDDWESWVPLTKHDELVEIQGIGLGCCLMKASIFDEIDDPYFEYSYKEDTTDWLGEDFNLFKKFRDVGYNVYLDMNISTDIKHIGTFAFGDGQMANGPKAEEWKKKHEKKSSKRRIS